MQIRLNRRFWLVLLIVGLVLFFGAEQVLKYTGNRGFIPAIIFVGAFLVPVVFVTYSYEYEHISMKGLPVGTVAACFLWGGALGVLIAAVLEFQVLRQLGVVQLFGVGIIEESAKLIWPLAIYLRGRFRAEADGVLFGIAAGMGFAALETMGYGFSALLRSQGNVGVLEETLFIRGLLSPAGHAAWTGLVCAVLWRQRENKGHRVINAAVIGAFLLAIGLHAVWDIVNSFSTDAIAALGSLVIAVLSLTLLIRRMRESAHYHTHE